MEIRFEGVIPAVVTPFTAKEELNIDAIVPLVEFVLGAGVHGVFVSGSEGEFCALDFDERRLLIETVVSVASGRAPVYAAFGPVTTREAVRMVRLAEDVGADAVALLPPAFIRPSEDELFDHFRAVAAETRLPVLLYNDPERVGVSLSVHLLERLSAIDNVVGIKDSSGDLSLLSDYVEAGGPDFAVFVGRDSLVLPALVLGAKGAISAAANVAPAVLVGLYEAFRSGNFDLARELQRRVSRLRAAFNLGTFPVVIKEALNILGIQVGPARSPVGPLDHRSRRVLRSILVSLDLLPLSKEVSDSAVPSCREGGRRPALRPASRLVGFRGSGIRQIVEAAQALESAGFAVMHMEIGRPDFDTPERIKLAAIEALRDGMVHYTASAGIRELRECIAQKLAQENGLLVDPEREIIITVGAKEAVFIALYGLLDSGDEVIVPTPIWPDYIDTVRLVGGVPVQVPMRADWGYQVDPEQVERAVTPRSKLLIVHSPHNPTGTVYHLETLEGLAEIARRHNLIVISDEIYEKLVYDGAKHISIGSLAGMASRTLTINGFSKAYSMTGWRIGYVAGPSTLIEALLKVHQCTTTCAASFVQKAAIEAYRGDQTCVTRMVEEFDRRRRLVLELLRSIPGVQLVEPRGAFYVFPDFSGLGMDDEALARYLLSEAGVAVVPGSAFGKGGEGHIRLSYAASYGEVMDGMARIVHALRALASGSRIRDTESAGDGGR